MVLCLSLSELEAQTQDKQLAQLQETRHAAELLSKRAEKGVVHLCVCLSLCLSVINFVRAINPGLEYRDQT